VEEMIDHLDTLSKKLPKYSGVFEGISKQLRAGKIIIWINPSYRKGCQ
jgi:hypothetical protein